VASICSLNRPSDRHTYCEGPRDGRRGFEQQWTTAAAAEPMRESPVRYSPPRAADYRSAPKSHQWTLLSHGGARRGERPFRG
jgi:hypothetical protein